MPPCRPQMLHQLQTSSFLRSPSFPSSRPPQIEKERERDKETYAVFKLTTFRRIHYLPLFAPQPPSFHSHLSAVSQPAPGAMTLVIRKETHGRHSRDGEAQRDTNFRLNLTRGAKGRQGAARCCFR